MGRSAADGQPESLVYKHEKPLFVIGMTISVLFWLVLIIGTFGIALIYIFFAFLIYLFAQSGLLSYLRGNGTRISAEQFPDLHARLEQCCARLGIATPPDAFLIHAGGAFNAFAARFLGRNFLVLFSDIVDAMESEPDGINFYIGHELGHIRRDHLFWGPVLFPAAVLPLLGAAYSRAREYTCDLHGLACCPSRRVAAKALSVLATGAQRWKTVDLDQLAAAAEDTSGFWMSFHELVSGYPWLVKRVARVLGPETRVTIPGRHFFAWVLALFVPRAGRGGGGLGILVTIAIIGILAAVAIPAYQDYIARAKIATAINEGRRATDAVTQHFERRGSVPETLEVAGFIAPPPTSGVRTWTVDRSGVVRLELNFAPLDGKMLTFVPSLNAEKKVVWRCAGEDILPRYLPAACK
jgi:Zn-dependent protease with chaperone function/type II secretory pathway pseudopilin PulG